MLTKARKVAEKGYFMGGYPPFGFALKEVKDEYGKTRKVYVINEEEAAEQLQNLWENFKKLFEEDWGELAKRLIEKVVVFPDGYIKIFPKGIENLV